MSPRILILLTTVIALASLVFAPAAHAQGGDPPGQLFFSSASYQVSESAGVATITVFRSNGDDDGNISVDYTTSGGSASPGSDFTPVNGTLSWPDGDDDPRTFQVPILQDSLAEGNESVTLTLFNPTGGASLGSPSSATLTILDDDGGSGTCSANFTTLCLNNGRFRVRATFDPPAAIGGDAKAVQLTDDTGYFWFFNSANVEMMVKVLNGCPANGHFWVFAAGLTNVEVRLTVTDTVRGGTRTYVNPQRTPFEPIQATRAFATCP